MIITDQFVFVHWPKTGGTFVQKCLIRAHTNIAGNNIFHRLISKLDGSRKPIKKVHVKDKILDTQAIYSQHGGVNEIPRRHRKKPVVSVIRNPLVWYASLYNFEWWKDKPMYPIDEIKEAYPDFPNLDFPTFMDFYNNYYPKRLMKTDKALCGYATWEFIHFFCRNRDEVYADLKAGKDIRHHLKKAEKNVYFLNTADLNNSLFEYLVRRNYRGRHIQFILSNKKIFPKEGGNDTEQSWTDLYTPELVRQVMEQDALLFELFPEFERELEGNPLLNS